MSSFITGIQPSPFKITINGPPGVGKTTTALRGPGKTLGMDFEGGMDQIDCTRTPVITNIDHMTQYLNEGVAEGFETFVFDSADAMEVLLSRKICIKHKVDTIADLDWGKGYEALRMAWAKVMDMFDYLNAQGKNVILISHEAIQRYDDPRNDGYDRITLKMHQKSANEVISRMDAVLYMTYDLVVSKDDRGKGKAKGNGSRIIYTEERPAFVAKNRYGMPFRISNPLDIYSYLLKTTQETTNV